MYGVELHRAFSEQNPQRALPLQQFWPLFQVEKLATLTNRH